MPGRADLDLYNVLLGFGWARERDHVIATESLLVKDSEGPLEEGELDRAKACGRQLAEQLTAPAGTPAHAPA